MITKNNRNIAIKKPITGVVPQPGATLPYSALSGRKISPNRVLSAIILSSRELNYIILVYNTTHNIYYRQSFLFTSNLSNIIFYGKCKNNKYFHFWFTSGYHRVLSFYCLWASCKRITRSLRRTWRLEKNHSQSWMIFFA